MLRNTYKFKPRLNLAKTQLSKGVSHFAANTLMSPLSSATPATLRPQEPMPTAGSASPSGRIWEITEFPVISKLLTFPRETLVGLLVDRTVTPAEARQWLSQLPDLDRCIGESRENKERFTKQFDEIKDAGREILFRGCFYEAVFSHSRPLFGGATDDAIDALLIMQLRAAQESAQKDSEDESRQMRALLDNLQPDNVTINKMHEVADHNHLELINRFFASEFEHCIQMVRDKSLRPSDLTTSQLGILRYLDYRSGFFQYRFNARMASLGETLAKLITAQHSERLFMMLNEMKKTSISHDSHQHDCPDSTQSTTSLEPK